MTDQTIKIIDSLMNWQEDNYENVDSANDAKVFNIIGNIIGLLNAELLTASSVYDFIWILSLDDEVSTKVTQVYSSAFENAQTIN